MVRLVSYSKKITLKEVFTRSALFVIIMVVTVILSNPFLFYSSARERMLAIQQEKSYEISHGYTHEESPDYARGPQYWEPTLSRWYGTPLFLGFLALSLLWGTLYGEEQFSNRILLSWILPFSIYILYFVAV